MGKEAKSLIERVREQAGGMSAVLHWDVGMFFEAADTIESLQADRDETQHALNCIATTGADLQDLVISLEADKAELVEMLRTIKKYKALNPQFETLIIDLDELIAKHSTSPISTSEQCKKCNGTGMAGGMHCLPCEGSGSIAPTTEDTVSDNLPANDH